MQEAAAARRTGRAHRLRVTVLPSFAQRWLLPRIGSWRERHPQSAAGDRRHLSNWSTSQRDGFHAALRYGARAVAGPRIGASVRHADANDRRRFAADCAHAPAGRAAWKRLRANRCSENASCGSCWFAAAGLPIKVTPVAVFNDAGLMLQAAEQDLGLALSREPLAADALGDGPARSALTQLSIAYEPAHAYHLVYPPSVHAIGRRSPRCAQWLRDELELSRKALDPPAAKT